MARQLSCKDDEEALRSAKCLLSYTEWAAANLPLQGKTPATNDSISSVNKTPGFGVTPGMKRPAPIGMMDAIREAVEDGSQRGN